MPGENTANPTNANPTTDSGAAVEPSTPEAETTPQAAAETPAEGQTKPKAGKVIVDTTKRYLSEIVAAHSLSRVGDEIAQAVCDVGPGGILIVDDLDWAVNDIFYLDLRKKLEMLYNWAGDVLADCQTFLNPPPPVVIILVKETSEVRTPTEEEYLGITSMAEQSNLINIPAALTATGSALTAQVLGIGAGLQAIGDLIGYFRTDYEIKGQTLANPEDLYIQAMVAEDLVRQGRPVYLLNFNFIRRSELIETLGSLLERKYKMLSVSEKINSAYVAGVQVQIDALQADLKILNEKWIECLVKVDHNVIATLRAEIDAVENQLSAAQAQRTPASQITALEKHIADLRTKLLDELLEDTPAAIAAVKSEIDAILAKLKKNARDKKLTGVELKALNDQLKLLQTKHTDLVAATRNNTAQSLKNHITTASDQLRQEQRSSLPDSQIGKLEEHLAALRAKLVECLLRNDNDAKANLDAAIAAKKQEIESLQKIVGAASGIINQATKVNAAIDAFVSAIMTVPAGASHPPLVTACIRESLSNDTIRYILKVKLMSSGGDFITEDAPFYSRAVKTSYTGGGVVSYVMAEKDGQIVASGTVSRASALDHQLGEEPELRDWNIRTPESNTPGRTASLLLNLLLASSIAYMLLALVGTVIAIGENRPAGATGLDSGTSAVQAFLSGGGTVFSPPLYLLLVQAFFTIIAFRRDWLGTLGVVGLSVLGLLFGVGMLAQPILAEIFKPEALEGFKVLLAAGLIVIPFAMMVLGISEWRRRSAEK